MKLRTRLDVFGAALLSALGVCPVTACGGSVIEPGGAAGNAGSGNLGGGGSINHFPCKNPVVLGNGVVSCDGFTHRTEIATCASRLPRPDVFANLEPGSQCASDADCTAMPHGWCATGGQVPWTYCDYGCVQDSECAPGLLCECGDPVGRCVPGTCNADANCGSGFLCKGSDQSGGCLQTAYSCQSSADLCGNDADCVGSAMGPFCLFEPTTLRYACGLLGCQIGRPFLVLGDERRAPAVWRSDWQELERGPHVAGVPSALRARLGHEWTRVALMEHASIAAFARFTLQLMSLGAPPELIERATSAMADETKHAKACFAVASAYTGEPVGPGLLSVARSLDETSLCEVVLTAIREGCVGETVAAIEAREACEHASDPALRALLLTISQDETRHAELAFGFVRWALAQGDATLRAAVQRELAALEREPTRAPRALDVAECELLQNGVVPPKLRQVIRARAISEVILPCMRVLVAPDRVASRRDAEGFAGPGAPCDHQPQS